jgi:HSP20 family molecular chaperone IbpA
MTDRSAAGTFFDALSLPARLLRAGLAGDENARVRVDREGYVLELDLPGFDADAFDVSWEDGYLEVSATGEDRSYEESFRFPSVVRPDDIRATYDPVDGVLTVHLPVRGRRARVGDASAGSHGTAD